GHVHLGRPRRRRAARAQAGVPARPAAGGVPGPDGLARPADAGARHRRRAARGQARAGCARARRGAARRGRAAPGRGRPLPAPVLRRAAPAHLDRASARPAPVGVRGRRAGERAGRVGARAGPQPARRPRRAVPAHARVRRARPRRRAPRLRHDRRAAPRRAGRARAGGAGRRRARAPVHAAAGRRRAHDPRGARRPDGGRPGPRCPGGAGVTYPVDEEAVVALTRDLVRLRTVNEDGAREAPAAQLVAETMRSFGWEPLITEVAPGRPNVVAVVEGGGGPGRTLAFEGHTDVVTEGDPGGWSVDPYGGEIRDGRLYGRGSADMKSGVAAMLHGVRALQLAGPFPGRVLVCALVDEEGLMLGAKHFAGTDLARGVDGAI